MERWWNRLRRVVVLALLLLGTLSPPAPADIPGVHLLVGAGAVLVSVGWLLWCFAPADRWQVGGLLLYAFAGVGLAILTPASAALAFPAIACLNAAQKLPRRQAVTLTVTLSICYPVGRLLTGLLGYLLLIGPAVFVVALLIGLVREQNTRLATEAEQVREARAESAALDERARIAREIHDVLAHSLAALTVQLETADALLEGGRTEQARDSVRRAGQLAREGMTETRRAIGALRGEAVPLPELLAALAASYRADLAGPVAVQVDGVPRELPPDSALALYRTAQEALTNVRKHAPGAPITIALSYLRGRGARCRSSTAAAAAARRARWRRRRRVRADRAAGARRAGRRHVRGPAPDGGTGGAVDGDGSRHDHGGGRRRSGGGTRRAGAPARPARRRERGRRGRGRRGGACALVAAHAPDVVLMDLRMPRCDGVAATAPDPRRAPRHPGGGADHVRRGRGHPGRAAGRRAGLPDQGRRPACRSPRRCGPRPPASRCWTRSVQQRLLAAARRRAPPAPAHAARLPDGLTAREAEVLRLIADRPVQPRDRRAGCTSPRRP